MTLKFHCETDGLANSESEADQKIKAGEIIISPCQNHDAIGSLTGVYYPSMPVFVVENKTYQHFAYCSIYEGSQRERLTYGIYNNVVAAKFLLCNSSPIRKALAIKAKKWLDEHQLTYKQFCLRISFCG